VPRALRRRSQARREAREESDFRSLVRADAGAPELVLSPHWDDAALDCWSLLEDDRELAVVNVFGGIPPSGHAGTWEAIAGLQDTAARARGRMAEDRRALERAGRTSMNLPLLDAEYRRQTNSHVRLAQLDAALAEAVPSASRVHVPAGIGAHVDHLLVRRYGRLLLRAGIPVSLYAELPYCVFHGWPSWVDGADAQPPRDVDAYWRSFMSGVPEMPALRSAVVERLDARASTAKAEAVASYELSLNYAARRMLLDPAVLAFEVRWELPRPDAPSRAGEAM
jgi:LmbE family N-acetylglucosaminyl deacetylase